MPAGRPTIYNDELAAELCQRMSEGESLRSICRDEHMPNVATVCKWLSLKTFPEFNEQYAKAREIQAESLFEELFEIADDASNDWMEKHNSEGECIGWQLNGEHVQRSRLRLDTRKWALSKMFPKKFGEFSRTELTGKDGEPMQITQIARKIIDDKK